MPAIPIRVNPTPPRPPVPPHTMGLPPVQLTGGILHTSTDMRIPGMPRAGAICFCPTLVWRLRRTTLSTKLLWGARSFMSATMVASTPHCMTSVAAR